MIFNHIKKLKQEGKKIGITFSTFDLLLILPLDVRILGVEYAEKEFTGRYEGGERGIELVFNGRDHSFSSSSLRKRVADAQIINTLNK